MKRKTKESPQKPPKKKIKLSNSSSSSSIVDIEDLDKYLPLQIEIPTIRKSLIDWFDVHKRTLPWRMNFDEWTKKLLETDNKDELLTQRAYEVWVSEIMLQQTRVQTVIDYYNKWMKKFPTLKSLSEASLESVNEEWSGLGYYRRAKHLLEGAKCVIDKHNAVIPQSAKGLLDLPGIGQYTAGAISSIVFNEVTPLVDGNVIRVLSRLCAIDQNPKQTNITKLLWKISEMIVDDERPGCFNQSLMELGATVCSVTNPNCNVCPVKHVCRAFLKQNTTKNSSDPFLVTEYPIKVKKAAPREETIVVCILLSKDDQNVEKYLITQRPDSGLLASLWEFPTIVCNNNSKLEEGEYDDDDTDSSHRENSNEITIQLKCAKNLATKKETFKEFFLKHYDIHISFSGKDKDLYYQLGETSHLFTHIKQKLIVDMLIVNHDKEVLKKKSDRSRWLTKEELNDAALSKGMRKCLDFVCKHNNEVKNKKNSKTTKQSTLTSFFH